MYRSTKTYDYNEGLSCCFRQWRATHSHCSTIHGYSLRVQLVFEAESLDDKNWVVDFGGLKEIKNWLHDMFDHTCLVAQDDPELTTFKDLNRKGLIDLRILPSVGCEATAKHIFDYVKKWTDEKHAGRVDLYSVEVNEHSGNSALYIKKG